jgi:hypothetical protein
MRQGLSQTLPTPGDEAFAAERLVIVIEAG